MLKKVMGLFIVGVIMAGSIITPTFAVDYGVEYQNQPTKSYSQVFSDVGKSHWAFSYIGEMTDRGVISGYPNGYFYPENYVTRAEFSKIMCVAAGISIGETDYSDYADVNSGDWFLPYVESGKYYLSGYVSNGQKYYRPNDNALREDIAVALVKLKGYSTVGADESMLKAMFSDWQSISTDARKYVASALENGLISGYEDNTFRGQDSITRAEATTLLWRAYQYGNENKTFEETKENSVIPEKKEDPTATPTEDTEAKEKAEEIPVAQKKAAYICDTITAANISDTFKYSTYDENDSIYYYDEKEKTIYRLSVSNRKKVELFDIEDFQYQDIEVVKKDVEKQVPKIVPKTVEKEVEINPEIDYGDGTDEKSSDNSPTDNPKKAETAIEEITETVYETVIETVEEQVVKGTYKGFYLDTIYYNTGDNSLYIIGAFKKYAQDNSLSDKVVYEKMIFTLKGSKATFVSKIDVDTQLGVSGNFSDGRLIIPDKYYDWGDKTRYIILNLNDMSNQNINAPDGLYSDPNFISFVSGSAIYSVYTSSNSAGFSKYSFSKNSWEKLTSASAGYVGVKDDVVYYWDLEKGLMAKSDTTGKISYIDGLDTKNDVDVVDFKDMPAYSYTTKQAQKMYITDKYGYVFYDSINNCWRSLRKQK